MRVLIVYNKLWPYRIPIFSLLAKKYDLTVAYSLGEIPNTKLNFKIVYIPIWKYKRFVIHQNNLIKFCNQFEVVISYGDISWLSLMILAFLKRSYGLIYWSIGVRASYNTKYNERSLWDNLRFYFFSKADALLLYSDFPLKRYIERGWDMQKLFIAHNTVKVNKIIKSNDCKDRILFIGTLYKEKGISNLLNAYLEAKNELRVVFDLHIIGEGMGYKSVKSFIQKNKLKESVILHGPITDECILSEHFKKSFACISPNQAGLSVLHSMGYGCPFITKRGAITGGEIFNISDGINGILYNHSDELKNIIIDINKNPTKYINLGNKALDYYYACRKPSDMADGIIKAIEFVSKNNN